MLIDKNFTITVNKQKCLQQPFTFRYLPTHPREFPNSGKSHRRPRQTPPRILRSETGTRKPNLAMLLMICPVLDTSPCVTKGPHPPKDQQARISARLNAAANVLETDDLR